MNSNISNLPYINSNILIKLKKNKYSIKKFLLLKNFKKKKKKKDCTKKIESTPFEII